MDVDERGLTIDELAERAGVPVRTVRFYIAERLLPGPGARGREASYGEEHLLRLMLVRRLSERGQRLAKIRAYLEGLSLDEVRALLAEEEHDAAALEAAARAPSPRAYVGELLRRARAARKPAPHLSSTAGPPPAPLLGAALSGSVPDSTPAVPSTSVPAAAPGPPASEPAPVPADPSTSVPASPAAPLASASSSAPAASPPASPAARRSAPSPGAPPPALAPASPLAGRAAAGPDALPPAPLAAESPPRAAEPPPLGRTDLSAPAGGDLWRRLVLAPGVELHVRLDTASLDRSLVRRLLRAAGLPEDSLDD